MKKFSLGIVGLVVIGAIYYFMSGSAQLSLQMKNEVQKELTTLQTEGFSVQNRKVEEEKEHFILSFDEPQKMAQFFTKNGAQVSTEDTRLLQGLQIGVDINYLADIYNAVAIDIYPVKLPTSITLNVQSEDDKKVVSQIQTMLDKKRILVHIDINKLGTSFKGYMKDIDEVIQGKKNVKMVLSKLLFSGDIKDKKPQSVKQTLEALTVNVEDELQFNLSGVKSDYSLMGKTQYDYTTHYTIDKMSMHAEDTANIVVKDFSVASNSTVVNKLSNTTVNVKTKGIAINEKNQHILLDTLIFDIKSYNLNMQVLERLGQMDPHNEKEMNDALQEFISHGIRFEVPAFSVASIDNNGQKMDGFQLSSMVDIDKSLNIASLQHNPMSALSAIDASLDFTLSADLFGLMAQQPQAVMAMMLFQPKDVNGQKVYKVELKDGSLSVNGKPLM